MWSSTVSLILVLVAATEATYKTHVPAEKLKCYQCGYSPATVTKETIKVPRIIKETVEVPRYVTRTVSVPKVVSEEVEVTKLVTEQVPVERTVYRDVKVPKVVSETVKVPRIVKTTIKAKSKKSHYGHYEPHPIVVTKLVHDLETRTKMVYQTVQEPHTFTETIPKTKTVTELQTVTKMVFQDKVVTEVVKDIKEVTKEVFDEEVVETTVPGGWEGCAGAFTEDEAVERGVDVWDCHDNCYLRVEGKRDLFRGCYKGEYAVDPTKIGCHEQNGATWCFCEGSLCNNEAPPEK